MNFKVNGQEVADPAEAYEIGLAAGREEGYEQGYEKGWNERSTAQAEIEADTAEALKNIKSVILLDHRRKAS